MGVGKDKIMMKYDTLITDFLEKFPEFHQGAEEEADLWRGTAFSGGDDVYSFFLYVLSLFMKENLPEIKDRALFKRIFDFVESMAASDDNKVKHILKVQILWRLVLYPENLKAVWPLMGEKTKLVANEVQKNYRGEPAS